MIHNCIQFGFEKMGQVYWGETETIVMKGFIAIDSGRTSQIEHRCCYLLSVKLQRRSVIVDEQ